MTVEIKTSGKYFTQNLANGWFLCKLIIDETWKNLDRYIIIAKSEK